MNKKFTFSSFSTWRCHVNGWHKIISESTWNSASDEIKNSPLTQSVDLAHIFYTKHLTISALHDITVIIRWNRVKTNYYFSPVGGCVRACVRPSQFISGTAEQTFFFKYCTKLEKKENFAQSQIFQISFRFY